MKSLYKRQLIMMVGIVALSFTLLSTAFMLLSYRYIISETRDRLERNAGYIASFTSEYFSSEYYFYLKNQGTILEQAGEEVYRANVQTITAMSDADIIVADTSGEILYASQESFYTKRLPLSLVNQILDQGGYTGITTLNGLYDSGRYIAGLPFTAKVGNVTVTQGLVLVSGDTSGLSEMWRATATIFFFAAVVVLLISVIASSITSAHQTRPLTEMAEAARKFGRGEFDVRVDNYKDRCDEIGELAEAFNTMANSLAKVENQRADFIANVSHELKTPMTTISGFAEGILDGTIPPEKERDALNIIVSETRRLSRLVRRMLDLSRLNALAENSVTAQEQFDLTDVISKVIISLEGKITERNLDMDVQMPEDKLMVWGDPDAVTQVCYNLLDNAAKFAAPGTAITVNITKKDGKAYTSFSNLGSTIPADELPLLFERFHKADYSRSQDRDGVGLGLYIVKTLLGNLKENINVTSEDGVTTFTFTLTLA